MYQLAARMGTKVSSSVTSQDVGFHHVLNQVTFSFIFIQNLYLISEIYHRRTTEICSVIS